MMTVAAPSFVLAELTPSCGGRGENPCTLCDLFIYSKQITDYLTLTIAPLIAVLAFSWGGFKILMSGANPGLRQEGMKAIRNGVIGILIVFGAWMLVSEFISFLAGGGFTTPWTEITCYPVVTTTEITAAANLVAIPSPIRVKDAACTGGTSACKVNGALANKLSSLANYYSPTTWQITEAYPPTVTHKDPCHQSGTCVDINFIAGGTASITQIDSFISAASKAGLRAVYEVSTTADRDALLLNAKSLNISLPSGAIIAAGITAPHFSVYNN